MNKLAIITGGSRGLGRADALHAAKKGIDSIITYNTNKDEADRVVAEIKNLGQTAVALQLDASDITSFPSFADSVKQALQKTWKRDNFDFLVNNAGFALYQPITEVTEDEFDSIVNVHFKGVFFLTQTLLPLMTDGGRIINISTGLTRFSQPGSAVYAAAKGAVEVLTKYMALELGARHISAVTIAPGAVATDFGGGRTRDNEEINNFISSVTALGRAGEADDIGSLVATFLTDDAAWVNGTRVEASGGMRL